MTRERTAELQREYARELAKLLEVQKLLDQCRGMSACLAGELLRIHRDNQGLEAKIIESAREMLRLRDMLQNLPEIANTHILA